MLDLTSSKPNHNYCIIKINLEGEKKRHLEDMGFILGANFKVLSNNAGDIILYIKNTRVGVTKKIANGIIIHEINEKEKTRRINNI